MDMNKKGAGSMSTGTVIFIALAVIFVFGGLFGYAIWSGNQAQTVQQESLDTLTQTQQAPTTGSSANMKMFAYDQQSETSATPVGVLAYVQDKATGTFNADGTLLGTATRTNIATTQNSELSIWCGVNSTWYAQLDSYGANGGVVDPMNYKVTNEAPQFDCWVHKVATQMKITLSDSDAYNSGTTDGDLNITQTGAGTNTEIDKMKIENNGTDNVYRLAGVYFDTLADDNITNIDVVGSASVSGVAGKSNVAIVESLLTGTETERFGEKDDYLYEFDDDTATPGNQPIWLQEGDYIETGAISVTVDGSGCSGVEGTGDYVFPTIFDKACYRSSNTQNIFCDKVSNDASTPVDVGGSDFVGFKTYCRNA